MWKQQLQDATSYDYTNAQGAVVANVRMVGIKGRWRWACPSWMRSDRKGWFGTKASQDLARLAAEEYLRAKNAL